MLNAWIEGIGLLGPGLDGWPQALAVLRGEAGWANAPAALPAPELLLTEVFGLLACGTTFSV